MTAPPADARTTRGGVALLRMIGLLATAAFLFVAVPALTAIRAGAWLAVPDLAALELSVLVALAVAATAATARGQRAFRLLPWPAPRSWRARVERLAVLWCAALAAALGALPGLALGLGPAAVWPAVLITLATTAARGFGTEPPPRIGWLLCTSYGLSAALALFTVRHVF